MNIGLMALLVAAVVALAGIAIWGLVALVKRAK